MKPSFFQSTYNIKTKKQTIDSLSLCQLDDGRLAEGDLSFEVFKKNKKLADF